MKQQQQQELVDIIVGENISNEDKIFANAIIYHNKPKQRKEILNEIIKQASSKGNDIYYSVLKHIYVICINDIPINYSTFSIILIPKK